MGRRFAGVTSAVCSDRRSHRETPVLRRSTYVRAVFALLCPRSSLSIDVRLVQHFDALVQVAESPGGFVALGTSERAQPVPADSQTASIDASGNRVSPWFGGG